MEPRIKGDSLPAAWATGHLGRCYFQGRVRAAWLQFHHRQAFVPWTLLHHGIHAQGKDTLGVLEDFCLNHGAGVPEDVSNSTMIAARNGTHWGVKRG